VQSLRHEESKNKGMSFLYTDGSTEDLYAGISEREQGIGRKLRRYERAKRIFDVVFASLAFVILLPFLLLIGLAIWVDDPHGSPIYVSNRCGKDGKLFRFYKFRSMCVGADRMIENLLEKNEAKGPAFKIREDPRLTRFGKIIRKYCIDELPQLLNVIRGDISIVGPRPPLPREVGQYTAYQRQRLSIQPGLTCYWQIQPDKNEMSFEDWMNLDLKYIRERSFRVDMKMIWQTVRVVLFGFGI